MNGVKQHEGEWTKWLIGHSLELELTVNLLEDQEGRLSKHEGFTVKKPGSVSNVYIVISHKAKLLVF